MNALVAIISVSESVIGHEDIPWEVLKRRGHESVRLMELTRSVQVRKVKFEKYR
jgi:hypothetical protein